MIERAFSPRAQQALALAAREAIRLQHNFVGTEHVLLGLIALDQGNAVTVLRKAGLDLGSLKAEIERSIGTGTGPIIIEHIPYTPRVRKVLKLAMDEARAMGHHYVGTEHLLLGLLVEGDGVAGRILKQHGLNVEGTRRDVLKELDTNYAGKEPQPMEPQKSSDNMIDLSKRYDVYLREGNEPTVYRNVLFKGSKKLFQTDERYRFLAEYVEIEQPDGKTLFFSRTALIKFCEHVP